MLTVFGAAAGVSRGLTPAVFAQVGCDFVDAATKGAVAVIDGNIPPINPMERERSHMFVYNSIFFSFAVDSLETVPPARLHPSGARARA